MSCMSCSSSLDGLWEGWLLSLQLLLFGMLPSGLIQYSLQHSSTIAMCVWMCVLLFGMRKKLRINFYLWRTFCPHLGRFFLCCFFFHCVSAKFHLWPSSVAQQTVALSLYGSRWALSEDSGFKSYPSRPEVYLVKKKKKKKKKTWCDRQQLRKAVITGDTVTRLSIPIRGRGTSPEEGQRWNLAEM